MLIIGSNDKIIKSIKDLLNFKFDIKDMRPVNLILGIEIMKASDGLILSQFYYLDKIL